MFHKKYGDFSKLIWEDFSYQIDNKQLNKGRRKIMPYPRFTKVIIKHFLSIHESVPKELSSGLYVIKDDGVLNRMKFVMIGKRSQCKKSDVTPKPASVEVSDESDPEPARRQTSSRRISKKKVSIFDDDNIILEPNVALELGKFISLNEVAEEEPARQVHATRKRIVTKSDPEPAGRKPSEQLAANMMQALKASRKSCRSQPHVEGSSKGTGVSPRVPDESTVILTTLGEGTDTKPGVLDEEEEKKDDVDDDRSISLEETDDEEIDDEETDDAFVHNDEYVHDNMDEEMKDAEVADTGKGDEEITDTAKADAEKIEETDDEEIDDEETDDAFVHNDEYVHDNMDEEMKDAKVADTGKGDEEITDRAKADAEKIEEVKDDNNKTKLPPSSFNLSVSLGFGNQFLNLSSDRSIVKNLKDTIDAEINSLLDVQI
nr:hypothetical protein [Tanacetum cinerariifolium]